MVLCINTRDFRQDLPQWDFDFDVATAFVGLVPTLLSKVTVELDWSLMRPSSGNSESLHLTGYGSYIDKRFQDSCQRKQGLAQVIAKQSFDSLDLPELLSPQRCRLYLVLLSGHHSFCSNICCSYIPERPPICSTNNHHLLSWLQRQLWQALYRSGQPTRARSIP